MKKRAFTLAEVLITLTILGAVAAIAVPNLVRNYQKRITVTKLAKAYHILEEAATNLSANTNCIGRDLACTGILDDNPNAETLGKRFVELSGMKNVKLQTNWLKVYSLKSELGENDGVNFNRTFLDDSSKLRYSFSNSKGNIVINVMTNMNIKNNVDQFFVRGRDYFTFVLYGNFVVEPATITWNASQTIPISQRPNSANTYCNKDDLGLAAYWWGFSCAARIIQDGWKMNY